MNPNTGWLRVLLILTVGVVLIAFAVGVSAQVQTTHNTTTGEVTKQVQVEHAEVVYVSGNDLVVKMDDGQIRHFSNVPDSTRVMVDGKELGIHDLKPGMTLQRTITTTTVPKTITTTQTVTGKVWHVQPPTTVILTLEDGKNQEFKIPKGQTFLIDGQQVDAWHLKKGMTISATRVTEQPVTVIEKQRQLTGSMPPPPPAPPANAPILVASAPAAPAPPAPVEEASAKELPKTGGELPLLALLGCLSLAGSGTLRLFRNRA